LPRPGPLRPAGAGRLAVSLWLLELLGLRLGSLLELGNLVRRMGQ
jgi:hypothetical protein